MQENNLQATRQESKASWCGGVCQLTMSSHCLPPEPIQCRTAAVSQQGTVPKGCLQLWAGGLGNAGTPGWGGQEPLNARCLVQTVPLHPFSTP